MHMFLALDWGSNSSRHVDWMRVTELVCRGLVLQGTVCTMCPLLAPCVLCSRACATSGMQVRTVLWVLHVAQGASMKYILSCALASGPIQAVRAH